MTNHEPRLDRGHAPISGARFTVFHALWCGAAIASGLIAFKSAPDGPLMIGILIGVAVAALGFFVFSFVVLWLVGMLVIPRTRPGTYWHYEVDCYMRSVVGQKWVDAGEIAEDG
jgi:hypothetical protein